MGYEIYILDLIGTFTFAVYGSYYALKKDFDIFGIFVSALLSGLGGGTIREILLHKTPFYFYDTNYILAIILAVAFAVPIYKKFNKIKTYMLLLDSIGLVTFAFIGASIGAKSDLGIFAITFLATITAVGGGVLRDITLNKVPQVMYYDFYASVAILLGITYGIFAQYMSSILWANLLILAFLGIRIIVVIYNINLWKPRT